jgi:mercuric ion transport protein
MQGRRLMRWGGAAVLLGALCCFTPLAALALSALGLAMFVGAIDLVAIPVLLIGLLAVFVGWRKAAKVHT